MGAIYKHLKWKILYNGTNDYQELKRALWKEFYFHPEKENGGKSKPEKMIRKKKCKRKNTMEELFYETWAGPLAWCGSGPGEWMAEDPQGCPTG